MPLDRVGLGYEGDMMTVVRRGKSNLLPVSWEVFCTATAKNLTPDFRGTTSKKFRGSQSLRYVWTDGLVT